MRMVVAFLVALLLGQQQAMAQSETFGNFVNGLPAATGVGTADQFYVRQGGVSKQIPASALGPSLVPQAFVDAQQAGIVCSGVDQAANLQAALAAYPAGATFFMHSCTYSFGCVAMPNNGASNFPTQASYWFVGMGDTNFGYVNTVLASYGTVFQMNCSDPNGMWQTLGGNATLGLRYISFLATPTSHANPFLLTTATTLDIDSVSFQGSIGNCANLVSPVYPDQDAIILGGYATGDPTTSFLRGAGASFQGYGTSIRNVMGDRIRRMLTFGTFAADVHADAMKVSPCSGNHLFGATAVSSIASAGTGYAVNDRYCLNGGVIDGCTQVTITGVNGSGGITSATIAAAGGYTSAPSNPVGVAHQLCDGTPPAVCNGSGATFNLTYAQTRGQAFQIDGLDAVGNWLQVDNCEMVGYPWCISVAGTLNTIQTFNEDWKTGVSVGGVILYQFGGTSNYVISSGGPSPYRAVAEDGTSEGICSNLNTIFPLGGQSYDITCFVKVGNLIVNGSISFFGIAGNTNEIRINKSVSFFDIYTDNTNVFLANFNAGGVSFQNFGDGTFNFQGQSGALWMQLFQGGGLRLNAFTTPGLMTIADTIGDVGVAPIANATTPGNFSANRRLAVQVGATTYYIAAGTVAW